MVYRYDGIAGGSYSGVLYLAGQRTVRSLLRDRLTHVVQNSLDYIEFHEGKLELDDDMDFSSTVSIAPFTMQRAECCTDEFRKIQWHSGIPR